MDPTEILVAEHRVIRSGLAVLLRIARHVEGGPVPARRALDIVAFHRQYAGSLHHGKEEHILFPALGQLGLPERAGPIASRVHEHDLARALLCSMEGAVGPAAVDGAAFASSAFDYCRLMRRHMQDEERQLYPMARSGLPRPLRRTIADALRAHRVRHAVEQERCLAMLEALIARTPPGRDVE